MTGNQKNLSDSFLNFLSAFVSGTPVQASLKVRWPHTFHYAKTDSLEMDKWIQKTLICALEIPGIARVSVMSERWDYLFSKFFLVMRNRHEGKR